jgi:hypothetical protein
MPTKNAGGRTATNDKGKLHMKDGTARPTAAKSKKTSNG